MRKKLVAIASLLLAFIMSLGIFSGCNLVTVDEDKDMQQVVATVSTAKGVESKLYKQDLIMDYLNYGSSYVQYQGYTMEQTMELIVESRVNTMILVQQAMKALNENADYPKNEKETDVWNPARYLDDFDVIEAKYEVYNGIEETLKAFETSNDPTKVTDTSSETARTTPTNAVNNDEVSDGEKEEFVEKIDKEGFDTGSTAKRRKAFNRFVTYLTVNNLLGSGYKGSDIKTTAYFKDTMESQMEYVVLENYRELVQDTERAKYTFSELDKAYQNKVTDQAEWTNAEFVEALSSATVGSPVLYGANGTYGYVYNLLLGIDEIQTERIGDIKSNLSDAEKELERKNILSTTRIQDLRSTWITAGYDIEGTFTDGVSTDVKFTGDYTFTKDNSLPFQGTVTKLKEETDDQEAEYRAVAPYMGLDEFLEFMDSYLVSNTDNVTTSDLTSIFTGGNSIYRTKSFSSISDYENKINELLFAFSTDAGSLNTYKGYVIKPAVDAANSEEYVKTFATAGRELLNAGKEFSYVVVASDYGYHVMFFSQVISLGNTPYATLTDYLNANADKGNFASWEAYYQDMLDNFNDYEDTDSFLYTLLTSVSNSRVTNVINRLERTTINTYLYDVEDAVVIDSSVYQDLID